MFREIYSALVSESAIDQSFAALTRMLDHTAWMFQNANDVLHSVTPAEQVRDAIYERDLAINELERSIRRKIMRYLTINPGYDVATCLALITVARDAERIGDYCKNVFEVGQFYTEGFHFPKYREPLDEIAEQTHELIGMVSNACRDGDEGLAERALERTRRIRSRCDWLIEELFKEEGDIDSHEAVAYSLLARHYKRVAAHLANISYAVLGHLAELDLDD